MSDWSTNEAGLWCMSCGNLVASARGAEEEGFVEPEACRQCGFPDIEAVADYHCGDDEECWNCGGEGETFDCFDGFCLDAEIGCELCTRQCEVCS